MDILKSIQTFQQVVEDKSFSKAAEQLNLVPSAVSRQITELESWLGVRLINRTTRSLHLTDEGRTYLSKMTAISRQVNDLKELNSVDERLTGHVKISAPIMLGQQHVPQIISSFNKQHPDVKISLVLMNRMVDIIEEGFDMAIRGGKLSDSNFHARMLGEVSFKTVASEAYLKRSAILDTPSALSEHNCLVNMATATPRRWTYKVNGKQKSFKIKGSLEANDSLCILALAREGMGVAMLPEQYVKMDLATNNLTEVLSEFATEPLPVSIIYPSSKLMSKTSRALIDYFVSAFNEID
ncbi:LysR family transcriptional regulator [Marinomonas pollencensis]|uniref:LysR family transcriptional regulator for bpeEF and oprC n=1 Tax=Marinomonas pollencensis TaxID=491954 RepID=A0A3E0DHE6_9GAMM|nr:LysR family transcriptional regulator [Marinomonas pollencensis]REG82144.1 LysR family transcriptional regulator for bpeEF and oprC [Marinomonas pollencensis]